MMVVDYSEILLQDVELISRSLPMELPGKTRRIERM